MDTVLLLLLLLLLLLGNSRKSLKVGLKYKAILRSFNKYFLYSLAA